MVVVETIGVKPPGLTDHFLLSVKILKKICYMQFFGYI